MKIRNVGSGSKGNATIIFDEKTTLLIDFGLSRLKVKRALKEFDKTLDSIDYFLITHDHYDHIATLEYVEPGKVYEISGCINLKQKNQLEYFKEYDFGTFKITPLKTSHDASSPCGYLIKNNNETLVYITDTGFIPEETLSYIKNKDYYIIESNHDINLLLSSKRTNKLKARILSYKGHLSNEQSALYISKLIGNNTKCVALAHLSEECNSEEIALETYKNIFNEEKIDINKFKIICLKQRETTDLC